ncbi:hypothetical protein MTR_8g074620 [Medicago truncatula]|uniref:Uncharacterized protein n=1 Tax=Medicago truncatula TaxID=3880 RepID=G7LA97_MEDTR|nr:hypothetical protein MTR_8g074620 [Medicago truncatula]
MILAWRRICGFIHLGLEDVIGLKESNYEAALNNRYAGIAQLGERQTEDLKVACSIHAHRIFYDLFLLLFY